MSSPFSDRERQRERLPAGHDQRIPTGNHHVREQREPAVPRRLANVRHGPDDAVHVEANDRPRHEPGGFAVLHPRLQHLFRGAHYSIFPRGCQDPFPKRSAMESNPPEKARPEVTPEPQDTERGKDVDGLDRQPMKALDGFMGKKGKSEIRVRHWVHRLWAHNRRMGRQQCTRWQRRSEMG